MAGNFQRGKRLHWHVMISENGIGSTKRLHSHRQISLSNSSSDFLETQTLTTLTGFLI